MIRRLLAIAIVPALLAAGSIDLSACGDKFLRPGKSSRWRRYQPVHPASILIYTPVKATPAGIRELETLLKKAGHRPLTVPHGSPVSQAVSSGPYDLVIAEYADASRVKAAISDLPSRPDVLPILHEVTKAVAAEAEREYPFLLKPQVMSKTEALVQIDHLMDLRRKGTAAAAASR